MTHRSWAFAVVLLCSVMGCKRKDAPEAGADQIAKLQAPASAQIDVCASVATLYPRRHMEDPATLQALSGRQWSDRDGGLGSMHGPPKKWRRSTDLRFAPGDDAVEVHYEETSEATDEPVGMESWTKSCQICGHAMVCDQELTLLRVRETESDGKPIRFLDSRVILEVGENSYYLVRHGHEILLELDADPLEHPRGTLKLAARKLEAGAPVVRATLEYESTQYRGFSVELPGDAGGFRVRLYPGDRHPAGGGYGSASVFRKSLVDFETLKLHPKRLMQPISLEISDDEKGAFNLPHN